MSRDRCEGNGDIAALQKSLPALTIVKPYARIPRPNIPLPRELRDQIYYHLLDPEAVQCSPCSELPGCQQLNSPSGREKSAAPTYRFSTNILGVNKAIQKEAKEYLAEHSKFVAVVHSWPELKTVKHRYDVPIVTEHEADSACMMTSLSIYLAHPDHPVNWSSISTSSVNTFIMLWRDFDTLKRALQWLFFQIPCPVQFEDLTDEFAYSLDLPTNANARQNAAFQLRLGQWKFGEHEENEDAQVFLSTVSDSFRDLCLPGLHVGIHPHGVGALNAKLRANKLGMCMGWPHANGQGLMWKVIDTAKSLKSAADNLATDGQYSLALERYEDIHNALADWSFRRHIPLFALNAATLPALHILLRTLIDVVTSAWRIHLKLLNIDRAVLYFMRTWADMVRVLKELPLPDELRELYTGEAKDWLASHHPSASLCWITTALVRHPDTLAGSVNALRLAVFALAASVRAHPENLALAADHDTLKAIVENAEALQAYETEVRQMDILKKLSIHRDPIVPINSPIPESILRTKPATIVGWCGFKDDNRYRELEAMMVTMATVLDTGDMLGAR